VTTACLGWWRSAAWDVMKAGPQRRACAFGAGGAVVTAGAGEVASRYLSVYPMGYTDHALGAGC
jgi:hypothetical protein